MDRVILLKIIAAAFDVVAGALKALLNLIRLRREVKGQGEPKEEVVKQKSNVYKEIEISMRGCTCKIRFFSFVQGFLERLLGDADLRVDEARRFYDRLTGDDNCIKRKEGED